MSRIAIVTKAAARDGLRLYFDPLAWINRYGVIESRRWVSEWAADLLTSVITAVLAGAVSALIADKRLLGLATATAAATGLLIGLANFPVKWLLDRRQAPKIQTKPRPDRVAPFYGLVIASGMLIIGLAVGSAIFGRTLAGLLSVEWFPTTRGGPVTLSIERITSVVFFAYVSGASVAALFHRHWTRKAWAARPT